MAQNSQFPQFPPAVPPKFGEPLEVLPGIYWLSTALPFRLRSINLWLLRDSDGWTMVDCGFPLPEVKQQIEAGWSRVLEGRPITRLIVTHHHPDHVGNCRWICERWGIVPTMTRGEYERAQRLMGTRWVQETGDRLSFWQRHGLPKAAATEVNSQWGRHRRHFELPPAEWHPLEEADLLRVGGCDWRVLVVQGHSPEQALLYSPERNLLLSGDQILPRITPNVSVFGVRADQDPLGRFLCSNRRVAQTCADAMVLPSHEIPFVGLQARIQAIEHHHDERLANIVKELTGTPRTAAAFLPILFGKLNGHEIGFAIGEVIAHLLHLVALGRAQTAESNGKIVFAAA
jgi:glyoxylase-like metal-dependent hydrolase (beta-lactamase superfamily II)